MARSLTYTADFSFRLFVGPVWRNMERISGHDKSWVSVWRLYTLARLRPLLLVSLLLGWIRDFPLIHILFSPYCVYHVLLVSFSALFVGFAADTLLGSFETLLCGDEKGIHGLGGIWSSRLGMVEWRRRAQCIASFGGLLSSLFDRGRSTCLGLFGILYYIFEERFNEMRRAAKIYIDAMFLCQRACRAVSKSQLSTLALTARALWPYQLATDILSELQML